MTVPMTFRVTSVTWRFELLCCGEYRIGVGETAIPTVGNEEIKGTLSCPVCETHYAVAQPVEILPTHVVKREVEL